VTAGTAASTGLTVPEGDTLGVLDWSTSSAVTKAWMTLPGPKFDSVTDFSGFDYLYVYYSTTASGGTTGADYSTNLYLTPSAGATLEFSEPAINVSTGAWTPALVSLNYARNLGVTFGSVTGVRIEESTGSTSGPGPFVCFDALALTTTAQDKPNSQLSSGGGLGLSVVSCSKVQLSWTQPAQDGTDPIAGYHIYRSTVGIAGPWLSKGYTNAPATVTYTDNAVPNAPTVYYVVLPFSSTSAAFGANPGYFTQIFGDPTAPPAGLGVNEALINGALAVSVANPQSLCSPTPSFSPTKSNTFTPSPTSTPTQTPTFSFTNTYTNSPTITDTLTVTPTSTPSPSVTDTLTPAPTNTLVNTAVNTPVDTATITPTYSVTLTPTTPSPTPTFTATPTISPLPSATQSFTNGPTPTVNVAAPAQLFPNPYHPDQGLFHLGNVAAGLNVGIYNMIGQKVRSFSTVGNPAMDTWDGNNANGVKVVTGIYFMVIQGNVYRLAVVRGQ